MDALATLSMDDLRDHIYSEIPWNGSQQCVKCHTGFARDASIRQLKPAFTYKSHEIYSQHVTNAIFHAGCFAAAIECNEIKSDKDDQLVVREYRQRQGDKTDRDACLGAILSVLLVVGVVFIAVNGKS